METVTVTELHAEDATETKTFTSELQTSPLVAEDSRTIAGLILPWNEFGRTNNGAVKFAPGSISVPADVSRVKLLAGHSPAGIPIGHATKWEATNKGIEMTFQLGSSDAATQSLKAAAESVIDAFSIEAYGIETEGTTVTKSILSAVALVPMPAYANARVSAILAEAPAPSEDDDSEDDEEEETEGTNGQTDPTPPTDPEEDSDMNKKTLTPGVMPGTAGTSTAPSSIHASLDQVMDYLTAAARGDETAELHAELTDITDAGMTNRAAPQWLGELWSGVTYQRRIIPLLTQAPLKSRKAVGYRWKTKPGVDTYTGNKTDIPSKAASIESVERDAQRWAGGNDLDRVFWDFKETEFLNAYWRAMAEDYAFETDQAAGKFLVDNAQAIEGTADNIIHAVARASITIDQDLHTPASFVLLNPADFESILQLTALEAPKYLDLIPATDPSKWVTTAFVPAGTVVLGAKPAVTHYELAGSPLRVEAEHIAKGGRDAALFGYTALMLNRPEGLRKINFTKAPAA